jgi:hypothetical protein
MMSALGAGVFIDNVPQDRSFLAQAPKPPASDHAGETVFMISMLANPNN